MIYSFKTTKHWRVDVAGRNAREAYRAFIGICNNMNAKEKYFYGDPTKEYIRYDKSGLASAYSWKLLK